MDKRHAAYLAYYKARAARYQANPIYQQTAATETVIAESLAAATSLEQWDEQAKNQKLNLASATALICDQARVEANHWRSLDEPVRASGPEALLEEFDYGTLEHDAVGIAMRAAEIRDQNRKDITVDELVRVFETRILILEQREIWATAEVPERWRAELAETIAESTADGREVWQSATLPAARQWDEDWTFDSELVWETRHRRRIPLPDEVVARRLQQFEDEIGSH